jgi:putative flippase GtrA
MTFFLQRHRRFLLFCLVGGLSFLLSLALLLFCVEVLKISYLVATILTWFCVNLFGFMLNKHLTFGTGRELWRKELLRYYAVMAGNLTLSVLFMYVLVDLLHIHYLPSSVCLAGLMLFVNYIVHNTWSFRTRGSNIESNGQ